MRRNALAPLITLLLAGVASAADQTARFDVERAEIRSFVADVSKRNDFDPAQIDTLLRQAQPQDSIIEAMARPAEQAMPWWQYRSRFLSRERIAAGLKFWEAHKQLLDRFAAERGVAPQYLLAILGIETLYGRNPGRYRVLDALATLAFDYPPRAAFFRGELEQLLLLTREEKIDPLSVRGSYAGAMGWPQFIPSSYRRFALDGDADGHRDLWSDPADVLASVANYFVEHGWQKGAPVIAEVTSARSLAEGGEDPSASRPLTLAETVGALKARGYVFNTDQPDSTPAILLAAEQETGPGWRVGFQNFYTITRYNRSTRYAMAVNDLADALAAGMSLPGARETRH